MGTILGKGFVQALVHNVNSPRAFGTRAINSMHLCLSKSLSQDSPHGEIRQLLNLYVNASGIDNRQVLKYQSLKFKTIKIYILIHFMIKMINLIDVIRYMTLMTDVSALDNP